MADFDAVVVGAGPNGLAAAIALAQAGVSVVVLEANDRIGGAARTEQLTLPGFRHDVCSAIHPMAVVSPFFRTLPLLAHGVTWLESPLAIAHPLRDGTAATLELSVDRTAEALGNVDARAYRRLMQPFARNSAGLFDEILRPIRLIPRHPLLMARFGLVALRSARAVTSRFQTEGARTLFTGCAAHSFLPLDRAGSASFGLALALAGHTVGWPCAKGGSETIIGALAAYLRSLGGEIRTSSRVDVMRDVPQSRAVIFDVTPRQLARIAASDLPPDYVRKLERFRYGPGVFKVDWALDGAIPWRADACMRAATVHVGSQEEIETHEASIWRGKTTETPFVLLAQQSLFDVTRAPAGKQTGWAYCHVPHGSTEDMTERIEAQIERYAPGFRDRILARHTMSSADFEAHDANIVGGDIAGGANLLTQFLARPFPRHDPYATPNRRIYIGSSSTPPGGGVHGMCGYWAAQSALRRVFGRSS